MLRLRLLLLLRLRLLLLLLLLRLLLRLELLLRRRCQRLDWDKVRVVPGSWADNEFGKLAAQVGPSKSIIKVVVAQMLLKKRGVHNLQAGAKDNVTVHV